MQRQPYPQQFGGGQQQCPQAAATYQEFLSTQPSLFTKAEDPLDTDVWLRVVESKFPLLTGACADAAKTRFAAQRVRGPARTWWDHFLAMLPAGHEVSWEEFKTAFRGHHIPAGILDRKLNEFLALNQGTCTILQYAQAFNNLCQYAGYHADFDEKKRDRLTPSCVSVSTLSGLIASMSWSTWPSPGGLYCSSPGKEEKEGTNVSTLRSNPEVHDCFPQSEQRILAAGRQMGDQATSAAAAST